MSPPVSKHVLDELVNGTEHPDPATVKVLNELYAANGQVGFRTSLRTDGDLRDANAVKTLKIKT